MPNLINSISLFCGLTPSFSALANFVIDAANHKIGYKFYAESTSEITHVDARLSGTGNTSGCTFKMRIETDSSGSPSGTVLGAATAGFAGPGSTQAFWAGGGTNPIALGTATGALTLNAPYWLVLYEDGTDPDASNYIQAHRVYSTFARNHIKLDDGSGAWTHATAVVNVCSFILKRANGEYQGSPFLGTSTPTAAPSIYDSNKQAVKYRFGSKVVVQGVYILLIRTATPTNLMVKLYEGTTLKDTVEIVSADLSGGAAHIAFSSPQTLSADTDIYVVLVQKGTDETDGGDTSNYYRLSVFTMHETYYVTAFPLYPRLFYGTGTDPTAFTESANPHINIPICYLEIQDGDTGLDCAAGGGGRPAFGDRNGGKF